MKTKSSSSLTGRGWATLVAGLLLLACLPLGCDKDSPPAAPVATNPVPSPLPPGPTGPPPRTFFFGAQTHFGQGWSPDMTSRIAAADIGSVRDELYWQIVEPTPGNFRFPANYDAYMAALDGSGISPLIELTFENSNYDGGQTPHTDAGFAAYARYATAVLQRYGSQIKALEIWNEYNGSFNRGPATADRAGTYVKMLRPAANAIRAVRPDVTIVGGATAGVPLPYFEKLFAAGALDYMDAVSIHPYRTYDPPEGLELQVAALQNLIARYNGGAPKPVWVTEIGWGTHPAAAPGDLAVDETTQAKFLVRACALLASAGVERVYWYLFRDDEAGPTMGLVRNDAPLSAKKAFMALQVLNTQLRGARFVAREKTVPGVYSIRFTSATGRELRILWSLTSLNLALPAGTSAVDMLGAPVPAVAATLALSDSPVFVTGPLPALAGAGTARATTPLADAAADFSNSQGARGWHYGVFLGDSTAFQPLPAVRTTDWKEEWTGPYGAISITDVDQHPGKAGGSPVAAVRRWVSSSGGSIHVSGRFRVGLQGDGVRVRILVDGQAVYAATLGTGTSIAGLFDFQRVIQTGSTVDFVVDPGAAGNIDFDATLVTVAIETVP